MALSYSLSHMTVLNLQPYGNNQIPFPGPRIVSTFTRSTPSLTVESGHETDYSCIYMYQLSDHVTYILEDLPGALCCLYEGHVVVEGQLLGGVKDTSPLLSKVLWLKLYVEEQAHS